MSLCTDQGILFLGSEFLDALRIRASVSLWAVDAREEFMPLDVGLDYSVSFLKGCFVGSDVLTWVAERGFPNHQWIGVQLERSGALAQVPSGQTTLSLERAGKQIGTLTSWTAASVSGAGLGLGLGTIQNGSAQAGDIIRVNTREGWVEARVVELPFSG